MKITPPNSIPDTIHTFLVISDAMDDAYWLDVLSEEKRAPNPRDLFAAAYG